MGKRLLKKPKNVKNKKQIKKEKTVVFNDAHRENMKKLVKFFLYTNLPIKKFSFQQCNY